MKVRDVVEREQPLAEDKPAFTGWLQKMCRAAARDLPAFGVGVGLRSPKGDLVTAAASGSTSVLVEELQFALGEGPCIAAYASRAPVLVPDLSVMARTTWPGYARAAQDYGVRAVFAFPLQVGDARLGALDVYQEVVGHLPERTLSRAHEFAEVTLEQLLEAGDVAGGVTAMVLDGEGKRHEVYQAQGMVMVQLGISADEAMARLRAYAFSQGESLLDVAQGVLARNIELEQDDPR